MFSVGSIGKSYSAAVAIQLCAEKRCVMDDPIHKYLPSYDNIDSSITIRQLMNHTSGLADFADNSEYWNALFEDPSRMWGLDEMLRDFIKKPQFPKGTSWNYATTNYVLLRKMIQDITGKTMPEIYRERLFSKLGLNNTFATNSSALPEMAVHSWFDLDNDRVYDEFTSWDRMAFASSIGSEVWATPADLALWMDKLIRERIVIPEEFEDEMFDFHSPCPGEEFIDGYGLGVLNFSTEFTRGIRAWGHAGNSLGFGAIAIYLPDYDVTVAMMDNTEKAEAIFAGLNNLLEVIMNNIPATE
jgi:D-alanyl-D-alanine carboxypeptidase